MDRKEPQRIDKLVILDIIKLCRLRKVIQFIKEQKRVGSRKVIFLGVKAKRVLLSIQEEPISKKVFILAPKQNSKRENMWAKITRNGKGIVSVMEHCIAGYIETWGRQIFVANVDRRTMFSGQIKAVNITGKPRIGLSFVLSVITNMIMFQLNFG